jgi:transcriptional regulator with XRE-family HTH domain
VATERVINVTNDQAVMGAVIAQIRENYGMQKQELAEKLKLSSSAWSRVEKGETTLTAFQLRCITEIFGVSSDQIFKLVKEAEDGLQAKGVVVESSDNFNPKVGWRENAGLSGVAAVAASGAGLSSMAAVASSVGAVAGATVPVFGALLGSLVAGIISYQAIEEQDKQDKE